MSVIKGQNLRIMLGGKCVAFATSCTFHVAAQTEDSSTKDSTGMWAESTVTGLSWDASTESLVSLTDQTAATNGQLPQDLLSAMIAGTALTLVFDQTDGTYNRVAQNSAIKKTGTAYITDWACTAANRQNSTLSVSFQGTAGLS